jgi:hypothetical protein
VRSRSNVSKPRQPEVALATLHAWVSAVSMSCVSATGPGNPGQIPTPGGEPTWPRKSRAAAIANTADASSKSGKKSGSGGGSSRSRKSSGSGSGGNKAQKQAAGRKGGQGSS